MAAHHLPEGPPTEATVGSQIVEPGAAVAPAFTMVIVGLDDIRDAGVKGALEVEAEGSVSIVHVPSKRRRGG